MVFLLLNHLFQRHIITHGKATQWNVFLGEQCDSSSAKFLPSTYLISSRMMIVHLLCVLHEIRWAGKRHFTHLLVLSEKNKICNGMVMCALPHGPTAFFKVKVSAGGGIYPDADVIATLHLVQNIFCW